ncbi:MAG: YecA family protein, partial [Bradyrhizobium sp.]|nr:YecA family protein [Bradyrhizobium sp.]
TQWVPLFAGDKALTAGEDAPEFRFIQSMVANYNRISACLPDFPALYRPRFEKRSNGSWDGILWMSGFLGATEFVPRLWNPVIKGHASTGDIIAPIRSIGDAPAADDTEMRTVAKAVVDIREYFMPRRVKDAKRR